MKTLILGIIFCLGLSSCTGAGGGDAPSITEPIKEIVGDIIGNTPTEVKNAQKQVQDVQQNMNLDANYQLSVDDQDFLLSESLIDDQSEIKSWVK